MLAAGVALILVSSVEVRVEDARGVSPDEATTIAEGLQSAISERSGLEAAVEGKSPCGQTPECLTELSKSGATAFVFIHLIGVPTRIRLIAERAGDQESRSEVDLTHARGSWPVVLNGVAEHLFPERPPPPPPPVLPPPIAIAPPPPPPPPAAPPSLAPWLLAGAGAAVLAVGIGFGVSSRSARRTAATQPHTEDELAALEDRAIAHGITANVMFGLGGAGLLGGLIWWIAE